MSSRLLEAGYHYYSFLLLLLLLFSSQKPAFSLCLVIRITFASLALTRKVACGKMLPRSLISFIHSLLARLNYPPTRSIKFLPSCFAAASFLCQRVTCLPFPLSPSPHPPFLLSLPHSLRHHRLVYDQSRKLAR